MTALCVCVCVCLWSRPALLLRAASPLGRQRRLPLRWRARRWLVLRRSPQRRSPRCFLLGGRLQRRARCPPQQPALQLQAPLSQASLSPTRLLEASLSEVRLRQPEGRPPQQPAYPALGHSELRLPLPLAAAQVPAQARDSPLAAAPPFLARAPSPPLVPRRARARTLLRAPGAALRLAVLRPRPALLLRAASLLGRQ